MRRIKILGAGSIGNHLANASRKLGWSVDLCDIDQAALERTRSEIYPTRYGAWDDAINLHIADEAPQGGHDLIMIGTPPDSHMDLALAAVKERPRALLIEKPLATPDLEGCQTLVEAAAEAGVAGFTGYDHVVGLASRRAEQHLAGGTCGRIETLDVEIREHWGGIFGAHPWLDGPKDSYLGYWKRGGGACGEHSHGLNLWQHFAMLAGCGRVSEVVATLDYVNDGVVDYDRLCLATLRTETGLVGRCVQDVVTTPPRKWARIQGDAGAVEWWCNYRSGVDAAGTQSAGDGELHVEQIEKTRPDDFIAELRHIDEALKAGTEDASPISLARGMDTMLVIAAAHLSSAERRAVRIDYSQGYRVQALRVV